MKKYLRFLLIFIFFSLLPAFLIKNGSAIYFNFIEEQRNEEIFSLQRNYLKEIQNRLLLKTDRQHIALQIRKDISQLASCSVELINPIIQKYEKKYPGLLQIQLYNPNFSSITRLPKHDKYIHGQLVSYLYQRYNNPMFTLQESRMKLVQRIIGEWQKPEKIAFNRGDYTEINYLNRRSDLFWHTLEFSSDAKKNNYVLLIVLDSIKFNEIFTMDSILAETQSQALQQGIKFDTLESRQGMLEAWFKREEPNLSIQRSYRFLTQIKGDKQLYTLLPLEQTHRQTLIAHTSKQTIFFRRQLYEKTLNLLLLLFISGFLILDVLIANNVITFFVSARFQLIALFLLGSLLPLSALYYLGFQYIQTNQEVVVQRKYEQLKKQVLSTDEAALAYRNHLILFSNRIKELPEMMNMEREKIKPVLNEKVRQGLLEDYYIFDATGEIWLSKSRAKLEKNTAVRFAKEIAKAIITYYNTGSYKLKSQKEFTEADSFGTVMSHFIHDRSSGALQSIFKNWGQIHSIDLFGSSFNMYLDVIPGDNGKVKGAFLFSFRIDTAYEMILLDMVNQYQSSSQNNIKLWTCPNKKIVPDKQRPTKFPPELHAFALQVDLIKNSLEDVLLIDGEKKLVFGTILKEVNDYLVIGTMPYATVTTTLEKNIRLFFIIFFISIIILIFLGILITRKFITPLKDLEKGVEAIAAGDLDHEMEIFSNDEFGRLSNTFNSMTTSLKDTMESLDRRMNELQVLFDISQELHGEKTEETVIGNVLNHIRTALYAHHCSLLLLNDAGDQLILKNIVGVNIPENQLIILKPDEGIAGEVLRNGKVVRVADVKNDERFKKVEDSNANLANSLLCAPLIDSKKIIGVINVVDSMRQEATFTVEDEHLLVSIASQLSMTMENLHLQTEMIEKERMSKELEIAGVIQENLFPLDHPKIVGYESDFNSNPAKEAGGDYYDYLPLDELRTGFVIADVSGKGVPAALVMVMVRSYLKVEGHKSILPQEVVARLNDHLTNMIAQDRFVTLLYGILNQADHTFHFTSAGHNYPIFYQHAEKLASEVELNGLILGVMDGVEFEEKTLEFAPLDILVLYTDGVTEAQNVDAVLYGEDRLCRLVEENADKTAHQLREIIENDVTEFAKGTPQGDDITLVVIKRDGDDLTKAEGKSTH